LIDGTFIFVAKKDILVMDFSKLRSDFKKALKRVGALDVKKTGS
jgi:RNase P protein component